MFVLRCSNEGGKNKIKWYRLHLILDTWVFNHQSSRMISIFLYDPFALITYALTFLTFLT